MLTTHQSPGLASASRVDHLPLCQSRPTGYPLPSPVLTPSSLPWQTHLCPSLPLSLQICLLDSRIYISDLDLLSRFYTHRHSCLEMKCSVLSVSETPLLSTSLVKLMTFALSLGSLPWTLKQPVNLVQPTSTPASSNTFFMVWPACFKGRSDLTSPYLKLSIDLGISILEQRTKYSSWPT